MIKGSKRELNLIRNCKFCGVDFKCCDPKSSRCPDCYKCRICKKTKTRSELGLCAECCKKHPTNKQLDARKNLKTTNIGKKFPGRNAGRKNSKKSNEKISLSKMGDLNPARIHRELFAAHIAKYRPGKVSKVEEIISKLLPKNFIQQYKFGWYSLDFADVNNKIVFEVQGCWYHSCQTCFPESPNSITQNKNIRNDKSRRTYLKNRGWFIIEIWEHEIVQMKSRKLLYNLPWLCDIIAIYDWINSKNE